MSPCRGNGRTSGSTGLADVDDGRLLTFPAARVSGRRRRSPTADRPMPGGQPALRSGRPHRCRPRRCPSAGGGHDRYAAEIAAVLPTLTRHPASGRRPRPLMVRRGHHRGLPRVPPPSPTPAAAARRCWAARSSRSTTGATATSRLQQRMGLVGLVGSPPGRCTWPASASSLPCVFAVQGLFLPPATIRGSGQPSGLSNADADHLSTFPIQRQLWLINGSPRRTPAA